VALAGLWYVPRRSEGLPSYRWSGKWPRAAAKRPRLEGFLPSRLDVLTNGEVDVVRLLGSWCPPLRAEHRAVAAIWQPGLSIIRGSRISKPRGSASKLNLTDDGNPSRGVAFDRRPHRDQTWGVHCPPETFIIAVMARSCSLCGPSLVGALGTTLPARAARPLGRYSGSSRAFLNGGKPREGHGDISAQWVWGGGARFNPDRVAH